MPRVNKVQCNVNLTPEGSDILAKLARYYGVHKSNLIEKLIREEAYKLGIMPKAIRKMLSEGQENL